MKNYPNIVGLCGRQFSGKTMLGKYLVENEGYIRVYVAQALKQLCSDILHISIEGLDALKHKDTEFKLGDVDLKYIADTVGLPYAVVSDEFAKINNTLQSTRHAYQFIGTELIRKYNPNWHIDMMFKTMDLKNKYVVDDVRFLNECDVIEKSGGKLMFVVRPQLTGVSHHSAEESLRWYMFKEALIINNQDKDFAINQMIELLETDRNTYGEEILKKYNKNSISLFTKSNNKTVIDNPNFPSKISVYDRTMGWKIEEFNGLDNPLVIEDYKFFID